MNLHEMAELRQLPAHQFMDRETLDWIKQTAQQRGLSVLKDIPLPKELQDVLHMAVPSPTFFTSTAMTDGLHGARHCTRVALLAGVVMLQQKPAEVAGAMLAMIAGSLHDCQRLNDNTDEGHGARSADWFKDHLDEVQSHYGVELSGNDVLRIDAAIRFHEADGSELQDIASENRHLVDAVKTADALDRYRQPKEKWWINEDYVVIKPSTQCKEQALTLMYHFEDAFLQTAANDQALAIVKRSIRYV